MSCKNQLHPPAPPATCPLPPTPPAGSARPAPSSAPPQFRRPAPAATTRPRPRSRKSPRISRNSRFSLLAGAGIGEADPAKGRFRSYLIGSLKHFLANQRRDANREKRGGGAVIESIDSGGSETPPGLQVADPGSGTGDAWFDRHWALAVMERGLDRVGESFRQA